ncbi:type IV secretory system conjugative DNA transfer family protein [Acidithiobacillus sp.]
MAKKNQAHRPDQNLFDYQTQRKARFATHDAITGAIFGGIIGNLVGGTVGAHILGPTVHDFMPLYKPMVFLGGFQAYSLIPFVKPFLEYYTKYPLISDAFWVAAGITAAFASAGYWIGSKKAGKAREQILENDIHGSAHWATREEVERMSLLPDTKKKSDRICYVGGYKEGKALMYLRHDGTEHIIAFAPTRSGKGVGLVLPTLLGGWKESVVVHDIKGENYALTAGYRRKMGSKVLKFNPGFATENDDDVNHEEAQNCHFNPLEEIRVGTKFEVKDVMNIATMIVDPDGKGLNDHWQKTGFALLVSVILHVLYTQPDKTMRGVSAYLNDPELSNVDVAFERMMRIEHDPAGKFQWKDQRGNSTRVHPVIAQSAREMLNKADNEKSGVISTMNSFLSLYRDPIVAGWTEYSDFRIIDLQDHEDPVSLYLVTSPEDKNRLKPLIRLILNQIASRFTAANRLVQEDGRIVCVGKHRLLLLLDEFPSLGKMDIFQDAIAFLAGYNVKLMLITQDAAQLEDEAHGYGKSGSKAIIGNCHIRIIYAPNQIETAKWVSDMLGTKTITMENTNQTYQGSVLPQAQGMSTSLTYQSRALLTPDEVMRLRGPKKDGDRIVEAGDMLVLAAGFAPVYGQQILYFKDPVFLKRARVPAPMESDVLCHGKDYVKIFGPHGGVVEAPSDEFPQAAMPDDLMEEIDAGRKSAATQGGGDEVISDEAVADALAAVSALPEEFLNLIR